MNDSEDKYDVLVNERDYYRSAFNILADLVWLKDVDGVFLRCNQKAAQLIGLEIPKIIGKTDYDLFDKDRADYFRKVDIDAMYGKFPIVVREYLNAADGSFKGYFETIKAPMKDESGKVVGVLGVSRDISEITEKQRLLNQKSKMDAIGQLAGGIAHDYNNMLGGILGAAELIKASNEIVSSDNSDLLDMIISTVIKSSNLTSKLLAFSRKGDIEFLVLDAHAIIENSIEILKSSINKNIKIISSLLAENYAILGDNSAIQNSLINLGINASHAMKKGGTLEIITQNLYLDNYYCESTPFDIYPGNFIEIEIRDTGEGIVPENLKRIFEPFFTTNKKGEGTGLGLASVFAMVKDHNGEIRVYSEVDTGTVFHIYLPITLSSVDEQSRDLEIVKGKGIILLVDDEEIIRKTGRASLEYLGYSVLLAKNGSDAFRIYSENVGLIDFVISDMIMPVMNGSELFYKLIKLDSSCRMIIASGFTKDENLGKLKDAGLVGFIRKPFRISEISKIIAKYI